MLCKKNHSWIKLSFFVFQHEICSSSVCQYINGFMQVWNISHSRLFWSVYNKWFVPCAWYEKRKCLCDVTSCTMYSFAASLAQGWGGINLYLRARVFSYKLQISINQMVFHFNCCFCCNLSLMESLAWSYTLMWLSKMIL
jgi:hypothetical protein